MNMCGVVSTEFPHLTAANFEDTLASDDVLVHFFNDFLNLPSFPKALLYNKETGLFELASEAPEFACRRATAVINCRKPQLPTHEPTTLTGTTPVNNNYTVWCLDREKGIQWIMEERFPFFLQSDCYIEYRLAKLLIQWQTKLCTQRRKSSTSRTTLSASQLHCSSQSGKQRFMAMYNFPYPCPGQKERTDTKSRESCNILSNCSKSENLCTISSQSSSYSSYSAKLKSDKTQELNNPHIEPCICSTEPSADSEMQYLNESRGLEFDSDQLQLEYLAARVVEEVLSNTLNLVRLQSQENISDCFRKEKVQKGKMGSGAEEKAECDKSPKMKSWTTNQGNVPDICCHCNWFHDIRPGLDAFKNFLRGTPGEKLINMWMDTERLKSIQHRERKNRFLVLMRSRYLLSSSQSSLNTELLSRLGLTTSPCWTEDKLCSVQPCLTDALLCYWAPRYWKSWSVQEEHHDTPDVGLWQWNCSLSGRKLHCDSLTSPPLIYDPCSFHSSQTVHSQLCSERSHFSGGRSMEKMLHALCVDSRAGSYFTNFCVQSGIQLWENAVYFWTDLQHYHELFNQDGLDPYRVQREAQLLYSTYLYSSARRTIGVDEEIRRNVHERLMPAFEELFDEAEEYTLNILLQPWALLLNQDKESFQKVCAQKEVHRVEGQEYSKLQTVYMETECQQKQMQQSEPISLYPVASPVPSSKSTCAPDWSAVSQSYRFGSLLHDRDEIGHFMTFLQSKDVSIHLSCWLDLEQYRRTKHRDKAVKLEKSVHVAKNYLNRKYFFGPDSPASTEQQNYILHLAGGLEHLTLGCLSNMVVMQIQDIISSHIETTWLPQFLSTAEFTERQKHKPKHQAADWLLQDLYHRCGTKRKAWKAEGLWMTSSKEILLFRQILLNPVTCMNFQHFVSLKGDFLENDVLFWLEVQRYKDLCHSHSDEATIQHKISTIINCFINSSMPPSLQIDIPPEQAQHILEKRHDLGPYIFREAQISVFSELLKFWPEFQELSSSVQEEQLLPLLQEKRINHRAHVRRQRRKEEEADEKKRVQEEQESEESSFSEDADDDMDDQAKEGRIGKGQLRTQSSVLPSPTPPLSWSYSKYMAALKREEVLLRKKSQLEASLSTASDSSSCSVKSTSSKQSHRQSHRSSTAGSQQCNRDNRRAKTCNLK